MRRYQLVCVNLAACILMLLGGNTGADEPASRTFVFNYGALIKDLPADAKVRVWLPMPQSNDHQQVKIVSTQIPGDAQAAQEKKYGNKVLYFEPNESGDVDFRISYLITRKEVHGLAKRDSVEKLPKEQAERFLAANHLVPLGGKPETLITDLTLSDEPLELGKQLYERVDEHMRYDKSQPGYGNGDAAWACDSRFGNCTDFHSLFISFARTKKLPAKFEIGFPLPPERGEGKIGGYHCWAQFHAEGHGWVPVDISEADKHPEMKKYYFGNLTEDRVTFTTGRDIDLIPKQAGPPLNYFVYPYVEVDGKPWPKEKIDLAFSYADQK